MKVTPVAPIHPSKKLPIRTSQFSRELLEKAYREVEAKKAAKKSG